MAVPGKLTTYLYELCAHQAVLERGSCAICGERISKSYAPMKEWSVTGSLCGQCYSDGIHKHYPGKHVRLGKD